MKTLFKKLFFTLFLVSAGIHMQSHVAEATVPACDARDSYTGNGATTTFAYTCRILVKTELRVLVAGVLKVVDTDYTVTNVGNTSGGNIVFGTAPADAAQVLILRAQPVAQSTNYLANSSYNALTVMRDLDRQAMIDQMQEEKLKRAIKLPETSTLSNIDLPFLAGGYIKWNALGTDLEAGAGTAGTATDLVCTAPPCVSSAEIDTVLTGKTLTTTVLSGSLTGTHTPAADGNMPVTFMTTGSTETGATNEGLRRAAWSFFDTKTDDINSAMITLDMIQTSNPGAGTIVRTGLHVKSFTMPDNGGETSGILAVSTGASNAISAYRHPHIRPAGFTDYAACEPCGYAIEAGTTANWYAVGVFTSENHSGGLLVNLTHLGGKGIMVQPNDASNTFDTRVAYAVGNAQVNTADINYKFRVLLDGTTLWKPPDIGANGVVNLTGTAMRFFKDTEDASAYSLTFVKKRNDGAAADSDEIGTVSFNFENDNDQEVVGAAIQATVIDNTDTTEDVDIHFTQMIAGTLTESMALTAPADTETALWVLRNLSGVMTLQRVSMDGDNTCGAGFKCLRLPN